MAAKGQVVVVVAGDVRDFESAMKRAEASAGGFDQKAGSLGDRLSNAGRNATMFASIPLAAAMFKATDAASGLEQSVGGVESVFGDAADTVFAFGETADQAAGLSKKQVNEMAAVIGASLKGLGFDTDEAATKVIDLEKRAADMAATFGGSTEEAIQAVGSALRGETDPIERYGVSMKAADIEAKALAMGLDMTTDASAKKSKALASLQLIMDSTADAEGAFAREADTAAGSAARATAEVENAAASLGQQLLPLAAKAAGGVADLAEGFGQLPDGIQTAVLAFAGIGVAAGPVLTITGNLMKLRERLTEVDAAGSRTASTFGKLAGGATAALAIVGVAAALKQVADGVGDVEVNVEALAQTTTAELVEAFNGLGESSLFAGKELEAFEAVADANLGTAERLRDALKAQGRDVDDLNAIIDEHVEAQRRAQADTERSTEIVEDNADATDDATEATQRWEAALEENEKALESYKDALDDTLGATLDVDEAHIKTAEAVEEMRQALKDGREEAETAADFNDRMRLGLIDLVRAVEDEVDAMAESGEVANTAEGRNAALLWKLAELKNKFPELGGEIDRYVTKLQAAGDAAGPAGRRLADDFVAGIINGFRDGSGRVTASADSLAANIERAARKRTESNSPSKVAQRIGGDFSIGLAQGIEKRSPEAIEAVQRMADAIAGQASDILGAIGAVGGREDAQRAVRDAEVALARAQMRQQNLPDKIVDAEKDLADARSRAAVVTSEEELAILRANEAVREAEEALRSSTGSAEERRVKELELTLARQALTEATRDARGPTRDVEEAEERLKELREDLREANLDAREAQERLTDAKLRAVQAEQNLWKAGQDLIGQGPAAEAFFRDMATAAGLTRQEIDQLIESLRRVGMAPGGSSATARMVDPATGRPAFFGPNGEGGWAANDPRAPKGAKTWTMPDGTAVKYLPGQHVTSGGQTVVKNYNLTVQSTGSVIDDFARMEFLGGR